MNANCANEILFADEAWENDLYWQKQARKMVERINRLIQEVKREPFTGVGTPEPPKHALAGFWSRRIPIAVRPNYLDHSLESVSACFSTSSTASAC